jgi:hypothetical protein
MARMRLLLALLTGIQFLTAGTANAEIIILGVTISLGSTAAEVAVVAAGVVFVWGVVGLVVWNILPAAPPPPPGADPDCADCVADRVKWDRMAWYEKMLVLVIYEAKQALCALKGCGWRLW